MKEKLLHFIWKLKQFSTRNICTTDKELIEIKSVGTENFNTGPDFLNGKIIINNQLWVGNIEIHIKSSDWYLHNHETDPNYDAVILHVVWEHDVEIFRENNKAIATLELKNYISKDLLKNYNELFNKPKRWINCENDILQIGTFTLSNWFERLYFERLEQKSEQVQKLLKTTNNNWESTLFVLLAKNFGIKINSEAFLSFALSFDFSIVRKVSNDSFKLEALFFGQAGLLCEDNELDYFKKLKKEYEYLKIKFNLTPILENQIQFFRLRPNNFPTIRLSQLAQLYFTYQNLFSRIVEIQTIDEFYELFDIGTSKFWETHYSFGKESKKRKKPISKSFVDLLIINTIVPLKFMHLKSLGKFDFSQLISLTEQIKPEKNSIISNFTDLKINSNNAFESQALIQLKNEYCNEQKCLDCAIGNEFLKTNC